LKLEKYSFGMGDRFAHQGRAQLQAILRINEQGVPLVPVWNKSYREHVMIGTSPDEVRSEADNAVAALNWEGSYYVDADHIGRANVDAFIDPSDFFTIDVADFIGQSAREDDIRAFVDKYGSYARQIDIPNADETIGNCSGGFQNIAAKYLPAIKEAGEVYRYIESTKGAGNFITEVSMDETEIPQTPIEMFFILAAMSDEGIPVQTIAPRFSGRFNKGVDYVGDVEQFARQFENHLVVVAYAVKEFGLPANLKLSVHSGSDKFSIYGPMKHAIRKHNAGLHVKTAGTTWLEEIIGLACAGGEGLAIAKDVCRSALGRLDELKGPYTSVIDIVQGRLPSPDEVDTWTGEEYAAALRHNASCLEYNPDLRQLLHIGYKVAAEMGQRYTDGLNAFEDTVAHNVFDNFLKNHLVPLFL